MTWGYDADVAHFFTPASSNTTFQHAQDLLAELERNRQSPAEVSELESARSIANISRLIDRSFLYATAWEVL